ALKTQLQATGVSQIQHFLSALNKDLRQMQDNAEEAELVSGQVLSLLIQTKELKERLENIMNETKKDSETLQIMSVEAPKTSQQDEQFSEHADAFLSQLKPSTDRATGSCTWSKMIET